MPTAFKVSLILGGVSLLCGIVSGIELYFGEFEFWKNQIPYRYSLLSAIISVVIALYCKYMEPN